jgi:hypothetical protein
LANTDKKTTPQADAIEYPVSCSFEMAQKDIPKTLAVAIRAGKGKPIGSKAPAERPRQGSTNINLWTRKQLNDPNSAQLNIAKLRLTQQTPHTQTEINSTNSAYPN